MTLARSLLRLGPRPRRGTAAVAVALTTVLAVGACSSSPGAGDRTTVVVTYSILGSLVTDLVGDGTKVVVLMPNGADPHEWEPSAKAIETVTKADLLVENGLDLEGGMANAFDQAEQAGTKRFVASDHITVRHVGEGEGLPTGDPDQAVGAPDPHLWMDPLTMRDVVVALADQLRTDLGLDVSTRATDLERRLGALNDELVASLAAVPADQRKLVTGHESLGYFAARYQFKLVGAIIPSLTTQAEPSAAELAALKGKIDAEGVKAIFTELGTPKAVADAIGQEMGVKVIELSTHVLPDDDSYFTFMRNIATLVTDNLK